MGKPLCMLCYAKLRKTTPKDACFKEGFIAICTNPKCNAEYDELGLDQCPTEGP